jgi:DNA-repair protein complementing XP-A cells
LNHGETKYTSSSTDH